MHKYKCGIASVSDAFSYEISKPQAVKDQLQNTQNYFMFSCYTLSGSVGNAVTFCSAV